MGRPRIAIFLVTLSIVTWSLQFRLGNPWRFTVTPEAEGGVNNRPPPAFNYSYNSPAITSSSHKIKYTSNATAAKKVNYTVLPDADLPIECRGKEKWLRILFGGRKVGNYVAICEGLPTQAQVAELYGDGPVVHGLETCERYRSLILQQNENASGDKRTSHYPAMPRVAGLYNSGTNAMMRAFQMNLRELFEDQGLRFEVPVSCCLKMC